MSLTHDYRIPTASIFLVALSACAVQPANRNPSPQITPAAAFQAETQSDLDRIDHWWMAFSSHELNQLVEEALSANLDVKKAWSRLDQAQALSRGSRSQLFPSASLSANALDTKTRQEIDEAPTQTTDAERASFGGNLSYEVDIWRRISSQNRSSLASQAASFEDLQATAFIVSGSVLDAWLSIREHSELLRLVREQLEANRTQLELLELRLQVGEASALDVLQQRQQLAATEAEIPSLASVLETSLHRLEVLLGRPPRNDTRATNALALPDLPPLPALGTPSDLLENRPDLRSARHRLAAADADTAAAVADQLPRLNLNLSYDFQADEFIGPFDRQVRTLLGDLTGPLFDGGRRKAAIARSKAIAEERLNEYAQIFLNALLEVENALVQERRQGELITALQEQAKFARQNLEEAEARYRNGLNDYLPVLAALESAQRLDRRIISERRKQLSFRADLYRALGGRWNQKLLQNAGTLKNKSGTKSMRSEPISPSKWNTTLQPRQPSDPHRPLSCS
ncbi:MAG: efflux transporter outer membrane subunit [Verrucomicrobiota bacterium]